LPQPEGPLSSTWPSVRVRARVSAMWALSLTLTLTRTLTRTPTLTLALTLTLTEGPLSSTGCAAPSESAIARSAAWSRLGLGLG
jgi:hypothetical protein